MKSYRREPLLTRGLVHRMSDGVSTGSGSDRVGLSITDNHRNLDGPDAMVVVSYKHTQSLPLVVLTSCATLDRQIDNLVYELYDLTPEAIAAIEGV